MGKSSGKRGICVNDRTLLIGFYLAIVFLIILVLMSMLAMTYAGSIDPFDLFHYRNFSYAYAGRPTYAMVYSDNLNLGLSSIDGSTASLILAGDSTMTLNPDGEVRVSSGSRNATISNLPVVIQTGPGNSTVLITVSGEDPFSHNMGFLFNNSLPEGAETSPAETERAITDNWIKLLRKGDNQYTLINSSFKSGLKHFLVKNNTRCNHSITIQGHDMRVTGAPMDNVERIDFTGELNVLTYANMLMRIPVTDMTGAGFNKLELSGAEGFLDVTHNYYRCRLADSIIVVSPEAEACQAFCPASYSSHLSLQNGYVEAHGYATSLEFRSRDFGRPISVILKEGHLAILFGLLSSFLTIITGKLVRQFNK